MFRWILAVFLVASCASTPSFQTEKAASDYKPQPVFERLHGDCPSGMKRGSSGFCERNDYSQYRNYPPGQYHAE